MRKPYIFILESNKYHTHSFVMKAPTDYTAVDKFKKCYSLLAVNNIKKILTPSGKVLKRGDIVKSKNGNTIII
jgi:hypothetical protein